MSISLVYKIILYLRLYYILKCISLLFVMSEWSGCVPIMYSDNSSESLGQKLSQWAKFKNPLAILPEAILSRKLNHDSFMLDPAQLFSCRKAEAPKIENTGLNLPLFLTGYVILT